MTDVALVMGFILFLFCVADLGLLCREENNRVFFLIFLKVAAVILSINRSVTQSKKMIQQCIFFTDIYLLVICMGFFFSFFGFILFSCVLLFCGGQTGLNIDK